MSSRKPARSLAEIECLEDRLTPSTLSFDPVLPPDGAGAQSGPAELAAVRFRSFANTGGREIYLGIPDLGMPGGRVETDYTWERPGVYFAALHYDAESLLLTTVVINLESGNLGLLFFDRFTEPLDLDSILIRLADRDVDSQVDFLAVEVDGTALGDFIGNESIADYSFPNGDLNDGFLAYGFLLLQGNFSQSAELSRLEIIVGRNLVPFTGPGRLGLEVSEDLHAAALGMISLAEDDLAVDALLQGERPRAGVKLEIVPQALVASVPSPALVDASVLGFHDDPVAPGKSADWELALAELTRLIA